ncbi:uncharacterized protein [Penaeus vannamei]|uniref:Uncharacterized protein n=1 Tax=Penaeus vannamei TaxID=6689 RepID=A0A423T0W3_PENVA|nr:uncharacterized protein LOC113813832 [Penaeus vannamei]XP_027221688.1 uncharacterized protein LOC113813832 [Penaeus vannamei]ROT70126.1 hypothetical protein C7M84_011604 [Penaeus vannamei]
MAEGETSDDLQTLIRPDDLEGITEESTGSAATHSAPSLLHDPPPAWQLPVQCVLLVLVTTALVIILPVYLESVNVVGDAYSALIFAAIFTALPVVLFVQIRYSYFCQFMRLGPSSPSAILKTGMFHGISSLMIVYALDRKRVVCHAQEPLMGLIVMYMIIIYFFYKGPELSSPKMFSLCGVLGGLFLAMDFQLNNLYRCHGRSRKNPEDDGGPWSAQAHALWTIVYAAALFLFTLSWLLLEREVITKKSGTGGLSMVSTVSGGMSAPGSDAEALISSRGAVVSTPMQSSLDAKWGIHLVWFTLASLFTIMMLFWTDFFTALGKAGSPQEFVKLTSGGLRCHFHWGGECGPTALYGWLFVALHLAFLVLLGRVLAASHSIIYALSVTSVALPVQALWWSMFRIGGPLGMEWYPQESGEVIFSLLGLPIMIACLCYWSHVEKREKQRSNNFPLTAAS